MPYATSRCCDADSHIMETVDWISSNAAPGIRASLGETVLSKAGGATPQFIDRR